MTNQVLLAGKILLSGKTLSRRPFKIYIALFLTAFFATSFNKNAKANENPNSKTPWNGKAFVETYRETKASVVKYCSAAIQPELLANHVKIQNTCFKTTPTPAKGKFKPPPLKDYNTRTSKICERSKNVLNEVVAVCKKIDTSKKEILQTLEELKQNEKKSINKDIASLSEAEKKASENLEESRKDLRKVNLHFKQLIGIPNANSPGTKSNQYQEAWSKGRKIVEETTAQSKFLVEQNKKIKTENTPLKPQSLTPSIQACKELKKTVETRELDLHKNVVNPMNKMRLAMLEMEPALLRGSERFSGNSSKISDGVDKMKTLGGGKFPEKKPQGPVKGHSGISGEGDNKEAHSNVPGKPKPDSPAFLAKERQLGVVDRTALPHTGAEQANREKEPIEAVIVHQTSDLGVPFTAEQWIKAGNRPDPSRGGNVYGAHYYIDKDGTIEKARTLDQRTNHIGVDDHHDPEFGLSNRNTIGIELVGKEEEEATEAQYKSLKRLSAILNSEIKRLNPEITESRPVWYNHSQISIDKHSHEGVDLRRIFKDIPVKFQGKGRTGVLSPGEFIN